MPQRPVDDWYVEHIARDAGTGYNAAAIYDRLRVAARAAGRKDSPPAEKTIKRYIAKLGLPGVPTLRPFRWPDSMGTELLPWEAGRAALDLLRFRDEQGLERPTVGEASWFWRLRQAAPTIPVEEGDLLAGWLAGADVLRALDRQAVSAIHDLEQRLTHERWGGTTVQKMIASRAAAREVLRRRFGEGVAGLIDDMATRSPTQPPLSPSAGAP
jgi:hypothetical protein